MPAWLATALVLAKSLAGGAAVGTGFELATRAIGEGDGGGGFGSLIPGIGGLGSFIQEKKKRRRRRRALTASDRADIAFIAGLLGATAGKNFALTIATRTG